MVGGYFEVSVNDANFVTGVTKLPAITSQPADGLNTLNVSLSGTYRYVRYVSPNNSYCNISEMQVFGPGGTASPIPVNKQIIGTPSSNTAGSFGNSGNTYAKAFDGNTRSFFDAPTANGNYVQLDLGSAQTIASWTMPRVPATKIEWSVASSKHPTMQASRPAISRCIPSRCNQPAATG